MERLENRLHLVSGYALLRPTASADCKRRLAKLLHGQIERLRRA